MDGGGAPLADAESWRLFLDQHYVGAPAGGTRRGSTSSGPFRCLPASRPCAGRGNGPCSRRVYMPISWLVLCARWDSDISTGGERDAAARGGTGDTVSG